MGYWKNRAEDVAHLKQVAQEYIRQQDPKKLKAFTAIVGDLQSSGIFTQSAYDQSGINEWIFKNCGNTVTLSIGAEYGLADTEYAGVFPPSIDVNNVIIPTFRKLQYQGNTDLEVYTKFIKENRLNGYFDNDDARIDGDLSKINSVIIITPALFTNVDLLPVELAAIILHEVGHIQYYFRSLMMTIVPNMVAESAANAIMEKSVEREKISVIKDIERILSIRINEPEVITKEYRKEVVYTKLVAAMTIERQGLTGSKGLENRNWERMADEYAAKFGAGAALATGLYKLEMNSGVLFRNRSYRTYGGFMVIEAAKIAAAVTMIGSASILAATFATYCVITGLIMADPELTIYDPPEERFKTQRQYLINELRYFEALKGPKVAEERKRILDGIAVLDELLAKVKDKNGLFDLLYKYLIPSTRNANRELEFQKSFEAFMSNDLTVASSKLKGIA